VFATFALDSSDVNQRCENKTPKSAPSLLFKGALCAEVIRLRVSYNQNDETLSRNSLRYLSKSNLPIAINQ